MQYQGVTSSGGPAKLQPGQGKGGAGPAPVKVSVREVIARIRAKFHITDEEALYIKEVTEEKIADPVSERPFKRTATTSSTSKARIAAR